MRNKTEETQEPCMDSPSSSFTKPLKSTTTMKKKGGKYEKETIPSQSLKESTSRGEKNIGCILVQSVHGRVHDSPVLPWA